MGEKFFYREMIWECGCYQAVSIFPVFKKAGIRRSKCKPTSEIQQKLNDKRSIEHLTRLIHTNFTENDHVIGLDYAGNCLPEDDVQAKQDVVNYLRRIKRLYRKHSSELKYIMVYERSEKGRPHFHLILNNIGVPETELRAKWQYGRTEIEPLQFDECGVVGLSRYVSKSNLFSKRWCASKNLKQPKAKSRDYTLSRKIVDAVRREDADVLRSIYGDGINIIRCDVFNNEVNRADYLYLQMFDYSRHLDITGKKPYTRIKKDKTAVRAPARRKE